MIVALGAGDGEPEEGATEGRDAVHHGLDAELLGVDAALLVDLGVAIEAGGHLLFDGGIRPKVAGELVDDELVVGLIAVERGDDPIAVFPDLARRVDGVAVGIGVAGNIKPWTGPTFAVVRRGEQSLDECGVGGGRVPGGIGEEGGDLGGGGRQAGQIEAEPADEGDGIGGGRG